MKHTVLLLLVILFSEGRLAHADALGDCRQRTDRIRQIAGCTNLIVGGKLNNSKLAAAYLNRSQAYRWRGQYERAIEDSTKAIRLTPRSDLAYLIRAKTFWSLHYETPDSSTLDKSLADYSKAVELKSSARNLTARGDVYRWIGQHRRAIRDYDEAVRRSSKDAGAYQGRGNAYMAIGRFDLALRDLDYALKLAPTAMGYHARSWANYKAGRFKDALPDAKKATELRPNDVGFWHVLGDIFVSLNRKEDAASAYRHALLLRPASTKVAEKLKALGVNP